MANIVTSIVTELLPFWMERRKRRVKTAPAEKPNPIKPLSMPAPIVRSPREAHKPAPSPAHWRASTM